MPERVIDADDLEDVEPAVLRTYETFGLRDNGQMFGRRGVNALTAAVAGSVEIKRSLGGQIAETEAELIRLTENQYEILDALDGNQRLLVMGGAGTSKTLVAIEEARRLAAQGHRVLVTCFNQPLGVHLAGQLRGIERVEALHFHGICTRWAGEAGIDHERGPDETAEHYYDQRAPDMLTQAADALGRRVDAVLVDEAQDFLPDWLDTLELLLDDSDGIMFLFADENQAIYQRGFARPANFLRYRLTANLRNSAAIHRLLVGHFGERSIAKGPAGVRGDGENLERRARTAPRALKPPHTAAPARRTRRRDHRPHRPLSGEQPLPPPATRRWARSACVQTLSGRARSS